MWEEGRVRGRRGETEALVIIENNRHVLLTRRTVSIWDIAMPVSPQQVKSSHSSGLSVLSILHKPKTKEGRRYDLP